VFESKCLAQKFYLFQTDFSGMFKAESRVYQ